jgi:hypothetical protein
MICQGPLRLARSVTLIGGNVTLLNTYWDVMVTTIMSVCLILSFIVSLALLFIHTLTT